MVVIMIGLTYFISGIGVGSVFLAIISSFNS